MADETPWVRTSERMPGPGVWVLGQDHGGHRLAVQYFWIKAAKSEEIYWIAKSEVTAEWYPNVCQPDFWMPIPPPPKEEKHDDARN